eukprot:COSAG05_NODE_2653_length_2799_cov_5.095556_2_plen_90_part_00
MKILAGYFSIASNFCAAKNADLSNRIFRLRDKEKQEKSKRSGIRFRELNGAFLVEFPSVAGSPEQVAHLQMEVAESKAPTHTLLNKQQT